MRLSDIMSHMQLTAFPIAGLVIFLITFAVVASRALSKRRRSEYAHTAALPLAEEHAADSRGPEAGAAS